MVSNNSSLFFEKNIIFYESILFGKSWYIENLIFFFICWKFSAEMLAELSRREKAANIKPDPDIDIYMKVSMWTYTVFTRVNRGGARIFNKEI